MTKVRGKKEAVQKAQKEGRTVHFATLIDICHLKNSELNQKFQKNKGRVVLRGDIVKNDFGTHAVFTEQGSPALQMTAAKVMDVVARLPRFAGQPADAVSACTQVKNGGRSSVPENHHVPVSRQLGASTTTQVAKSMVQYGRTGCSSGWEQVANQECLSVPC